MHPQLIQINVRLLHYQFSEESESWRVSDISIDYWKHWRDQGFDWIWLMGMWQNTPSSIAEYAFDEGLKKDYSKAIPDWQPEDVTGSPYAIDQYVPWERLGSLDDLQELRQILNKIGLKLMLDFVPNHFNAHSSFIADNPGVFIQGSEQDLQMNPTTYYSFGKLVFAHGKDPYFPAWTDTVQVDYSSSDSQKFMIEQLLHVADYCDGVRCDMAMLLLNEVFQRTWNRQMSGEEFWHTAIRNVKSQHPNFVLMAETYWDLEWQLQQLGFDYTYDKRLLDRLISDDDNSIYNHLKADYDFQSKSVRFLENHDEERAIEVFGPMGSQTAAVLSYTIPGMRFFFEGQQRGCQKHLPVQLGRPATEHPILESWPSLVEGEGIFSHQTDFFYQKLWELLRSPILRKGRFQLHNLSESLFQWSWTLDEQSCWIVINWSSQKRLLSSPLSGKEHFSGKYITVDEQIVLYGKQYAAIVTTDS